MSMHIQVTYEEGGIWNSLQVTGHIISEIRMSGYWDGKKVYALKYPDGQIWDFTLRMYTTWQEKKK